MEKKKFSPHRSPLKTLPDEKIKKRQAFNPLKNLFESSKDPLETPVQNRHLLLVKHTTRGNGIKKRRRRKEEGEREERVRLVISRVKKRERFNKGARGLSAKGFFICSQRILAFNITALSRIVQPLKLTDASFFYPLLLLSFFLFINI